MILIDGFDDGRNNETLPKIRKRKGGVRVVPVVTMNMNGCVCTCTGVSTRMLIRVIYLGLIRVWMMMVLHLD